MSELSIILNTESTAT